MTKETPKYVRPIANKLNIRYFFRAFLTIIQINILFIIVISLLILVYCDSVLRAEYEGGNYSFSESGSLITGGRRRSGFILPERLQKSMPFSRPGVRRSIYFEDYNSGSSFLRGLVYRISFLHESAPEVGDDVIGNIDETVSEGKYVLLEYRFTWESEFLHASAIIILISELIILISATAANSRYVWRSLKPIHDIVAAARDITPAAPGWGQLAGQISSIRGDEPTHRLTVSDKPVELRPLAREINALLDRINTAYEAQVRFVSDAAHELRTPISVVQGYADLLDRWGKTDEVTLQESIDAIRGEARSMKKLIEQLLFLARAENDTLVLNPSEFDASLLAEELANEMRLIDPGRDWAVSDNGGFTIRADRELLKQTLRIFLENSRKYSEPKSPVTIGYAGAGGCRFWVEDSGAGIPAESLPHIFDRFYRSDESRARKTGGSGLGLAIAKMICDRHGYEISIISREGIGTRISVLINN